MCNISFVILHYNNLKDTRECIRSLEKYMVDKNVNVVVVDNGSPQEKATVLKKEFASPQIYFIDSKENLGFAKGNNLGYKFAKDQLNADIIILTNSDTVYSQENFVENLKKHYKKGFDVAGPKIVGMNKNTKYKYNQNPLPVHFKNINDLKSRIFKLRVLYALSFIGLDTVAQNIFSKKMKETTNQDKDFQLHGSCLIFSRNYLRNFDGLYSGTFMYGEEDILKYRVQKFHLEMKYFDDIWVQHKGGATTDKQHGNGIKKRQFYYKWSLNSYNKLKKIMEEDNY